MRSMARTLLGALAVATLWPAALPADEKPWERRKREVQDARGGLPAAVLERQSLEPVQVPVLDKAVAAALKAAKDAAEPLLDTEFHRGGRRILVPDAHETIQAAIDSAKAGDTVVVRAGVYHELLTMKDGVRLVSDDAKEGNELVAVEGCRLKLPRRTLRTIVDGSRARPSRHGMVDFTPGTGRRTIIDGFTFRNLPKQNHHLPGHAHGLNMRGASPVVTNCYLQDNGSTGIGNHVVYRDQESPMAKRDFRRANIAHPASALLYRNIIRGSLGLGIGCNHFSTPFILGNEILENDDSSLGEDSSPGIGAKHGAAPVVIGNLVHDNPGGGILARVGRPQGKHPIDGPTRPTVRSNVVYGNGKVMPGISGAGVGSREAPAVFTGNHVLDAGAVGIGLRERSTGVVEDNLVSGSAQPGIAVHESTVLKLNRNRVTGAGAAGFVIVRESRVVEMIDNAADRNRGPRFVFSDSEIGE